VLEALEKLKGGMKFPEVAAQYSEDKARQGVWICTDKPELTLNPVYHHSFIIL
jgi:hypothetical protein